MPWRKAWIDPSSAPYQGSEGKRLLREHLEKRAYEVWISEIMLQQTRVATVISYWTNWTNRWPTIQDLAKASPDDVLSAWRGLGYYSRATRIHQAAQKVVDDKDMEGLLPATAAELEKQVPGVGKYTAGAISSIVFGRAEAILDGNVARVLSRQLALYANGKNKATTDLLWHVAQTLVEAVAGFTRDDDESSDVPGFWNQALMELGSTVCTPQQPKCTECPIRATCRAYQEGEALAMAKGQISPRAKQNAKEQAVPDIEDLCQRCEPFGAVEGDVEEEQHSDDQDAETKANALKRKPSGNAAAETAKKQRQNGQQSSLLSHFTKKTAKATTTDSETTVMPPSPSSSSTDHIPEAALQTIQDHVKLFPMKIVKAKVREEECVVCSIQLVSGKAKGSKQSSSRWLIQQRPAKGLLASLWEFPTATLPSDINPSKPAKRKQLAIDHVKSLPQLSDLGVAPTCKGELGSIDHVFSHLKLKMWVWRFVAQCGDGDDGIEQAVADGGDTDEQKRKWSSTPEVEAESMGTGMRNCWVLVQDAAKWK